ncbi:MAG: MogA/MoaB family molybdenum cofactor biosynthesis protein, partial [Gemmatimonadales bacterium]
MTITIAILTISDRCASGEREDASGAAIAAWASERGHTVVARDVVPDAVDRIVSRLLEWCDDGVPRIILTTGGTGLGPRDVTPEATRAVIELEAPGLAEVLRAEGMRHTPRAVLSRGVAGTRANALIVNLPGST